MRTGIHANTLRDADIILEYYRRSQAGIFKTMDFDRAFFQELKRVRPGVFIIGRVYEPNQDFGRKAQDHNRDLVSYARAYPEVDALEGFNEFAPGLDEIGRYAEIEGERVQLLAGVGMRAVVGNFPCGTPQADGSDDFGAWEAFLPALRAIAAHNGILGLHEYDAPWLDRLVEGDIWSPKAEGWLALRYRKAVRIIKALGVVVPWVALTETGIDGGVTNRPGGQGGGWAEFQGDPSPALGAYDNQRYWYNWQLSHDRYVLGGVSFGESSGDPHWDSFSAIKDRDMMDRIIFAESHLPAGYFGATPVPAPTPAPSPVPPPAPAPTIPVDVFPAIRVKKGEGWLSVARRAGVTEKALRAANFDGAALKTDQVLKVPGCSIVRDGAP